MLKVSAESSASFRGTENVGEALGGRNDFFDRVRVSGVRRNAKIFERVHGFQPIQFRDEDEIRLESDNLFEIRIDGAADFRFFLCIRWKVAVVGVADEMILQAKRVHCFGETRRKGDDALDGLRNADGAAGFINELFIGGRRDGRGRRRLGAQAWACKGDAEQRSRNQTRTKKSSSEIFEFRHKSPIQAASCLKMKKPRETPWGFEPRLFSRKAAASAAREGSLAYGKFCRLQWRDRGRFSRPFPLPLPAKLEAQCMTRAGGCQRTEREIE